MAATKDMLVDWQTLLKGLPSMGTLLGGRIYAGQAPQGAALPTLIWNLIAAPSDYTHDGHAQEEVLMQLDIDGITPTQCRTVADALRAGLSGKGYEMMYTDFEAIFHDGNEFTTVNESVTEGTTQTHRLTIDYRLLWRSPPEPVLPPADLDASASDGFITLNASGGRYTWPATGPAGFYSGPYTVSVTDGVMTWNWAGSVFTHPVSGSTPSATGAFTATAEGGIVTGIVGVAPYTWPASSDTGPADLTASAINGMIQLMVGGALRTWPATGPAGSYSGPYTVSVTDGMMEWNWGGSIFTHPVSGSTPSATGAFSATASAGLLTGIVGVAPYTWPASLV